MTRFIPVFLLASSIVLFFTLSWPRFFDRPRPEPIEKVNTFLRNTSIGQQAANVLGVSDDQSVAKISPLTIKDEGIKSIKNFATDILTTHLTRLIVNNFGSLTQDQQQKILEALTQALSQNSPVLQSEDLPEATQSSSNRDNNTRTN